MFTSAQPMPALETGTPPRGSKKNSRANSNSEGSSSTSFTSFGTPPLDVRPKSRKKKKSSPPPRILEEEKPGADLSFTERSEVLQKVVADAAQKASEDNLQLHMLDSVMSLVQELVASNNELTQKAAEQDSMILLMQQDRQVMVATFNSMLNAKVAEVNLKIKQLQEFFISQLPTNITEFHGYVQTLKGLLPELEGIRNWHQALSEKLLSGYPSSNPTSSLSMPRQLTSPLPPVTLHPLKPTAPMQPYYQSPLSLHAGATRQFYPLNFNSAIMPLSSSSATTLNPLLSTGPYAPAYAPIDNFTLPPSLYSTSSSTTLPFFSAKPPGPLAAMTVATQTCPSSTSSTSSNFRTPHL